MENSRLKQIRDWLLTAFPLIVMVVFGLLLVKTTFPNSDTFFIIKTGAYIVENGVVPTVNPFVIHEDFGVIIQQWLFDVMVYGIYDWAGNVGLYIYSAVVYAIMLGMMYRFFGFYSQNRKLKLYLLAACAYVLCMFTQVRPTSFSFLMCLSTVMVMEIYRKNRKWYWLLVLPALSIITINMHASMWPMLFVLMVPFIFPDRLPAVKEFGFWKGLWLFVKNWVAQWRWVLLTMIVMFLLGFVNPNGANGVGYLFLSYGSATSNNFIAELQSPEMYSLLGVVIVFGIVLWCKYIDKYRAQMDFAKFYMAAGTLLLAMMHNRNIWFLMFGVPPLVLTLFDGFTLPRRVAKPQKHGSTYALQSICLVGAALVLFMMPVKYGNLVEEDSNTSPVEAVAYLDQLDKNDVVLFTEFNSGAYLELHDYLVYIDARPELFQEKINGHKDVYSEYLSLRAGAVDFEAFIQQYGFTHLIVDEGTPFAGFLKAYDKCEVVVEGNGYCLYECH